MQAIDVMCLPSHREPFGLVYVEAALADKPVIACRAGGAPEVITHGETGLLVPPPSEVADPANRQITALADAIFWMLDNRTAAADMGAADVKPPFRGSSGHVTPAKFARRLRSSALVKSSWATVRWLRRLPLLPHLPVVINAVNSLPLIDRTLNDPDCPRRSLSVRIRDRNC